MAKVEHGENSLSIAFLALVPVVAVTVVAHMASAWSIGRDKRLAAALA